MQDVARADDVAHRLTPVTALVSPRHEDSECAVGILRLPGGQKLEQSLTRIEPSPA